MCSGTRIAIACDPREKKHEGSTSRASEPDPEGIG